MKSRTYPVPKLLRFTVAQWKAIKAHCKTEGLNVSQYIRGAIARDLILSRRK